MKTIIISKTALKNTIAIADYLEAKFSLKVRNEFIEKLKKGFEIIQTNPEFFPKSEINSNQYRFVLTKQTTIYYRINNKEIRILALFDTRQKPSKIIKIK
ncbi:type II toxin-antitoxin system RelE/ParE family toxin [Flavobacterium sp.]|jgi:plasmid stabilization system protein ParE|uniref:type II toxin-antitoxin system RelE/ParE family toxin n=1 Tax=Flavobacterium sp. TaxID=239 RepID=UPI0037C17802